MTSDLLQKFDFPEHPIRGHLVSLDATWRAVLERHPYPPRVRDALGEAMAASLLLAATLKFDGTLTLQVQGDGPISLLVVQATSGLTVRGLAHWSDEKLAGDTPLFGDGRIVVTLDPGDGGERYQGIVAVEEGTLAQALERYFERSEQLPTRLWLATGTDTVSGLLLQRMPHKASSDDDAWNRFGLFGDTLSDAELRQLDHQALLYRLFHEEDVRVFEPVPVSFRCTCTRERIEAMLRGMGRDEAEKILEEQEAIEVTCEFCNRRYVLDAVDVAELFAAKPAAPHSPSQH